MFKFFQNFFKNLIFRGVFFSPFITGDELAGTVNSGDEGVRGRWTGTRPKSVTVTGEPPFTGKRWLNPRINCNKSNCDILNYVTKILTKFLWQKIIVTKIIIIRCVTYFLIYNLVTKIRVTKIRVTKIRVTILSPPPPQNYDVEGQFPFLCHSLHL